MSTKTHLRAFPSSARKAKIAAPLAALFFSLLLSSFASAQLTGTKNIPGDYANLQAAIVDLDNQGVGAGGVTLNLVAGNPQTAPLGGYVIGGPGSPLLASTSTANQVVIQGNGNVITAPTPQTTGNLNDAIFKLVGADWITLTGFIMQENPGNTVVTPATANTMTEWGVALLYATTTDGAQNNTISANTISLNRAYANSFGIYSSVRHSPADPLTAAEATAPSGANSSNKFYSNSISNTNFGVTLIGATVPANMDMANDVGGAAAGTGNMITNWGGAAPLSAFVSNVATSYGIFLNHQVNLNVSFNTLNSATLNYGGTLLGIYCDYLTTSPTGTFTNNITSNTVTLTNNFVSATASQIHAIRSSNTAATATPNGTFNLNSNTLLNCNMGGATNSILLFGVLNTANFGVVNLNSNTIQGTTSAGSAGGIVGVTSQAAVVTTLNLNNNKCGTAAGNFITFSAATSGSVNAVTTSAEITPNASVSNNDIRGVVYNVATSTGAPLFIANTYAGSGTLTVNGNTFTNLALNTTGGATFIQRSGNMTATGAEVCNNNSIVTSFSKTAVGGTVTFYTSQSSSVNGSTMTQTGNNFSNVSVTGATTIGGWNNGEGASSASAPTKNISGNTFSNFTGGSNAVSAILTNFGNATTCTGNTISNVTGTGAITGISHGSSNGQGTHSYSTNTISSLVSSGTGGAVIGITGGSSSVPTMNIGGNAISGLSSTGASSTVAGIAVTAGAIVNVTSNTINTLSGAGATSPVINGMSVSSGTTVNVSRNKIYDLAESGAITTTSPAINGMLFSGGTTVNAFNNLIGDLRTPAASLADAIRGISITSTTATTTFNISFNTISLSATSSGTNFGTTGLFHTFVTTATSATLNLRDNILANNSTPNGTGLVVAFRRSAATNLNNYGSVSNNNDFYAGTPGPSNLIFSDGTNFDQTIGTYKTRVAPRDSASFSENPPFLSTTGSSPQFLHISPAVATQLESGGVPVSGITDDFDGDTRSATTPDIGADEFVGMGIDLSPPNISYTPLANTPSTANRTLTATISDATAVASGANSPRIYFKKPADGAYVSTQCSMTGGTPQNGTYSCTIDYSLVGGGSVTVNDMIQYFVVAQDTLGNLGSNPAGASGANVNSITFSGTPNTYTILPTISGSHTVGVAGEYADVTAAVAALNNSVITGPVTFVLLDSSYTSAPTVPEVFPVTINANSGSSSVNTVTFKPASGQTVTMTGSGAAGLITLNGADWIIFDGSNTANGTTRDLTITNTNAGTSSAVIWLQSAGSDGATNNTIKNVNLVGTTTTATAGTLIGVGSGNSTISISSTGAGNNNNTIQNCSVSKTSYGIYSGGTSAPAKNTGNVISQNVLNAAAPNNITTGGILVNFEDGVQITQNDIGNLIKHDGTTGSSGTAFGIALGAVPSNSVTVFTGSDVTNAAVRRNRVNGITQLNSTGFSGFGIVVNSVTSGTTLVSNNLISGIRTASTASDFCAGIVAGGGTGSTTRVYFNSVELTGTRGAATFPSYGLAIGGSDPLVDARNNIFYNTQTSTGASKMYAIGTGGTTFVNLTSDYNDFFVSGTNGFIGQTGGLGTAGTDRATLAAWQAATGKDANSKSVDPLFISATDAHLQPATPLLAMGVAIPGITTDFDGDTRPAIPTIGADEPALPGSIQFASATYSANETAPSVVLTVNRTGGSSGAVSVAFATANGTATAGSDYTAQNGTLNWADGDMAPKTITVALLDDMVFEGDEMFTVGLSMPTGGATLGAPSTATVTIVDDENAPTISIDSVSVSESAGNAVFTVTQSGVSAFNTTFHYFTTDGTAIAGSDYTGVVDAMGTIPAGSTTTTISIAILNDSVYENTETFTVNLTKALNATIGNGTGTCTITDDDAAPTFTINSVSMNEGNSGTTDFVFTVTKNGLSGQASSVDFATIDGTATVAGNDYLATSGTLNFTASDTTKTITVQVVGDTVVEPDETFQVILSNVMNFRGERVEGVVIPDGTGTIVNDDVASNNAALSDLTISAGTLTPPFSTGTFSYTDSVPFSTTSVTVTPTAADPGATITVNGSPVGSGTPSQAIALNVGPNTITIVVTAADGVTTQTYTITVTRAGNVTVNPGNGTYGTLKAAFDAINAGTHTGTVTVSIDGDTTENLPAVLNASGTGSSSYASITITPNGARTVSGAIAAGSPLIDLKGARGVTIDGLNALTNSLAISNTTVSATPGTSTIRFIDGASNDTVRSCSILGSSTGAVGVATGDVLFSTSTVAGGNSSNMISSNNIGPAGVNLATKGVMGLGAASPNANSGNVIDNNNIFDFFNPTVSVSGISVQANNTLWTISNNRLFQTAPRVFTGAVVRYAGITLNFLDGVSAVGGSFTVTGNRIGFGAADGTGTTTISGLGNEFRGIDAQNTDVTVATSVQNNTISGINQTTARNATLTSFATASAAGFIGIQLGGGGGFGAGFFNVGDVTPNRIGSLDASSSVVINATSTTNNTLRETGILDIAQSNDVISNNEMGTITINSGGTGTRVGFEGIQIISFPTQNVTVNNNIIGGTAAGSITDNIVGQYLMQGIAQPFIFTGGSGNISCTGNVIRNMVSNSNVTGQITMRGIVLAGSVTPGVNTVSQNTIHSLTNIVTGGGLTAIYAMDLTFPNTANVVERNFIHSCSITTTSTTAQVRGILMRGTVAPAAASNATFKNNMIRLGLDAAGASITTPYEIIGMIDSANTAGQNSSYYFNSVYIGGAGVGSPGSSTFAFVGNAITTTRFYEDNIFWNARSNAVAGGTAHYAISLAGTAQNPPGTTSNFNDLFASGTDGNVGRFNGTNQLTLANWQAATGLDGMSISADPFFVAPTGTAATVDLHLSCGSPAIDRGLAVAGVTNDFDNDPRGNPPDIGADETNFIGPTPVSAVSRKTHGAAGDFDVNLPFVGLAGVEPRSGGATGDYRIVVTFATPVNVGGISITSGTGSVSSASGNGTSTITIDLTGVANAQYLTLTLSCVNDGVNLGSVPVTLGILLGDVDGNGAVNNTDVSSVKATAGQPITMMTFRNDVIANGNINSSDVAQVKAQSGSGFPPVANEIPLSNKQ